MNTAEVFLADHPDDNRKDDGMLTTNEFTTIIAGAVGACMICLLPVTAAAAKQGDDIVVSSSNAMRQWQKQTTAELDRALMIEPMGATTENAIVQISFTLDEDGKAENLQFYNQDGTNLERGVAKRAIERLAHLGDVPVDHPRDARFLASIIFANDALSYSKLRGRLGKMEEARLASADGGRQYLALGY
jgi:hypothetical protein